MSAAVLVRIRIVLLVLLAGCVIAAGFLQQLYLAALPAALIGGYLLLQHPRYLLYALMATIPWSIEYNLTPTLGTDLPDEQLMWLGALCAIIMLTYRYRTLKFKTLHPVLFLLIIQFIWTAITVVVSTNWLVSAKYLIAKSWYLLTFIVLPLFCLRNKALLIKAAIILVSSMVLFMLVALVRHGQYGFTFEDINTALSPFYRNHVNYSALLVLIVPVLLLFVQSTPSVGLRRLLYFFLIVTFVALYLSFARGAWLALVTGGAAYFLLKRKLLFAAFVTTILLSAGIVFWLVDNNRYLRFAHDYNTTIYHTNFREHLIATYQLKDVSTAERYYRWIAGVRMSEDSWQTGFGPNTFYEHYKSYTVPAFKTWVSKNEERSTVHNYFLLLLIEQGVIGMLLFIVLLGTLFWYVQRNFHDTGSESEKRIWAVLAVIITMICVVNFLSDLIETDKVGSIFYLCIALLVLLDRKLLNPPFQENL